MVEETIISKKKVAPLNKVPLLFFPSNRKWSSRRCKELAKVKEAFRPILPFLTSLSERVSSCTALFFFFVFLTQILFLLSGVPLIDLKEWTKCAFTYIYVCVLLCSLFIIIDGVCFLPFFLDNIKKRTVVTSIC